MTSVYNQKRNQMKTGDVIAFKGTNIGAKAICQATKSKYSHVGLVVRIDDIAVERVFILESVPKGGVVLLPLSRKLLEHKGSTWWLSLKLEKQYTDIPKHIVIEGITTHLFKWAMGQLGKDYDKKLIRSIIKKIIVKKKLPDDDLHEFICSELVAYAFKEIGALSKNSSSNVTPKEIGELPFLARPVKLR